MSDWHPILAAQEIEPTRWILIDSMDRPYAEIRLVRRGGELGYRSEHRGTLVGYYRTLRAACMAAHLAYVAAHAPQGAANGVPDGYGVRTRR